MKIFFLFFCFHLNAFATQKPYIISGYDDVLKQAENTGLLKAALKVFEDDKTFSGMPQLYSAISKDETNLIKFVVVSGTSHWFEKRIDHFLTEAKFPANKRYLRNWLTEWSLEDFKISKIKEIVNEQPERKFIVIFDNSDASLELAEKIKVNFPKQVVAVYLRQVVKKNTPEGATPFFTAFDIAVNEFKNNRFNKEDVLVIGNEIVNETNSEQIFPTYATCPEHYFPCQEVTHDLFEICSRVKMRIEKACATR